MFNLLPVPAGNHRQLCSRHGLRLAAGGERNPEGQSPHHLSGAAELKLRLLWSHLQTAGKTPRLLFHFRKKEFHQQEMNQTERRERKRTWPLICVQYFSKNNRLLSRFIYINRNISRPINKQNHCLQKPSQTFSCFFL